MFSEDSILLVSLCLCLFYSENYVSIISLMLCLRSLTGKNKSNRGPH